ncbi:MAG: AbrB/MazE/SpoVT family DNA-binding domain-containing protein [Rhizobiaceae bacterium]|nr:AbrB/MazE/SpoVT family DNA-binding domain-containing protein [Rhizobiaceae bacterium]
MAFGERKAKIFKNGRSRAIRIPAEFILDGDEVTIRQENDGVITILPSAPLGLLAWLATLEPLEEADQMPEITDDDLLPLDDIEL